MAVEELEIDNVSKRYGDVVALRELTFEVRAGELFGFVGSNGAGKTTAMRVILGVLAADAGEVRWAGRPLDLDTRCTIGYMPEERGLYPKMKVAEQLVYRRDSRDAAGGVEVGDGVAGAVGRGARRRRVQKLSLGNQQRVQLAASLAHDPRILVLDEPFSGLDPVAVDVMSQVLRDKAREGIPVVFSSHQLELVERLCDRVGIIRSGHMVQVGPVDELRSGGPRRLVVEAPSAASGWASAVPGVRELSHVDGRTLLELGDGVDDQAVLRAAMATGPVRAFGQDRPSLTELFRHVVKQEVA
jgi:ABC-2 type transport system ATP-binding protein